jgi:hypothetical protein
LLPPGSDLDTALDFNVQRSGTDFSVERLAKGDYVLVVVAEVFDGEGQSATRIVSDTRPLHVTKDTEVIIDAQLPFELPVELRTIGGPTPRSLEIQLVRVDQLSKQTLHASVEVGGLLHDVGPGTYDVFLKECRPMPFCRKRASRSPTARDCKSELTGACLSANGLYLQTD